MTTVQIDLFIPWAPNYTMAVFSVAAVCFVYWAVKFYTSLATGAGGD